MFGVRLCNISLCVGLLYNNWYLVCVYVYIVQKLTLWFLCMCILYNDWCLVFVYVYIVGYANWCLVCVYVYIVY